MINEKTMFAELTTLKISFDIEASIISNELGRIERDINLERVQAASDELKNTISRLDEMIAKSEALMASFAPKKKWYQRIFNF